jgi:hypothetical protein
MASSIEPEASRIKATFTLGGRDVADSVGLTVTVGEGSAVSVAEVG